jgi:hypothetical protein
MASLRFTLTTVATIMGLTGTASAAVLPIVGIYGNAAGCQAYFTGNFDDDAYLLLTPDTFSAYASACDFAELVSSSDDVLVVSGVCFEEGEEESRIDTVTVMGSADEAFFVQFDGLGPMGPLNLCPPQAAGTLR